MNNDQIYEFTQRFESKAVNHHMSFKNYKDSLGLIGVDSLSFLADRMFAVMDEDSKGYVSLVEPVMLRSLDHTRRVFGIYRCHALRHRSREARSKLPAP